jgi:geranylgeranylglycerol-phosphate geranylgeranyltransferase
MTTDLDQEVQKQAPTGSKNAYVEVLRPINCAFGALTVLIGILNARPDYTRIATWLVMAGGLVVYFIVAGASNLINDICDVKIDEINRPARPIPSGRISLASARRYFFVLCAVAVILSIVDGLFTPNDILIPVFTAFFLWVGYMYARRLKAAGFAGNLTVGISFSFGIPFGSLFVVSVTSIPPQIFYFFATSALLLVSRELVKGMEDMEGDRKFNIRTVANVRGTRTSAAMSICFSIAAIVTFTLPAFYLIFRITFRIMMILGDAAVVASIAIIAKDKDSKKNQKLASLALKAGAFLGLVAYVVAPLLP